MLPLVNEICNPPPISVPNTHRHLFYNQGGTSISRAERTAKQRYHVDRKRKKKIALKHHAQILGSLDDNAQLMSLNNIHH